MQSKDSTSQKLKDKVNIPPECKEVLEMTDDDPALLQWMEEQQEKWRKKNPTLTQEKLDRRVDQILESEKELRKKSQY